MSNLVDQYTDQELETLERKVATALRKAAGNHDIDSVADWLPMAKAAIRVINRSWASRDGSR